MGRSVGSPSSAGRAGTALDTASCGLCLLCDRCVIVVAARHGWMPDGRAKAALVGARPQAALDLLFVPAMSPSPEKRGPPAWFVIVEDAITDALTLAEGLEREELLGSRLTGAEVRRQLTSVCAVLGSVNEADRGALSELDWEAWRTTAVRLQRGHPSADDALWLAVRALAPATLTWLRLYGRDPPEQLLTEP